jgi:hypothetical protein
MRPPMSLMAPTHHPQYDSGHEFSSSPPAQSAGLMMEPGPPPSPDMYGPLSPPISGSDTSAEGAYHSRNSSTSSSRANSLVHRNPLRYNPTPSPSSSSGRRRGRSFGDSDEDMGVNIAESIAYTRKEATRRQRIEAEQRRRDELRDGYARLKDVLPVSNQKSSKVSLLERGIVFPFILLRILTHLSSISDQPHRAAREIKSAVTEKNTGLERRDCTAPESQREDIPQCKHALPRRVDGCR